MTKIITKRILFLSLALFLSSCSVYKGSFDCKPHKGIGCESVSKVNELVNDDKLDEFIDNASGKKVSNKKQCSCQGSSDKTSTDTGEEKEKITIHFNQYQERGITYKESEVEVIAK
jgi:hypothetical protein